MVDLIKSIYSSQQFQYLLVLILANLILGTVAAIRQSDFHLLHLSDWLMNRLLPIAAGYGVAGLVAYVQPSWAQVQDLAYYSLAATLLGYLGANFKDLTGIDIPQALINVFTGGPDTPIAPQPPVKG